MDITILFSILLTSIFTVNFPLIEFLGTGATLENDRSTRKSLLLGAMMTVVLLASTAITWPVNEYILKGVPHLKNLVFVAIIIGIVQLMRIIFCNKLDNLCEADFTKFAINGSALGLCLHATHLHFMTEYPYLEVLITSVAVGVGFTIALVLCSSLHHRIDQSAVPKAFRGFPIQLLAAGMIVLAFLCMTK